jgi:methyl-accepting chemotaxis protein
MSLSPQDATRILRFCLGADETGVVTATDDGVCQVTITGYQAGTDVHRFEGATYEAALRRAAAAGLLKLDCLEKQIAFIAGPWASRPAGALVAVAPAQIEPFVEAARAIGRLLHETQRERGFSSLSIRSRGRLFGDQVLAQRARTDARKEEVARLWTRRVPGAWASIAKRWARAEGLMVPLGNVRASMDAHEAEARNVIETFSDLNASLLAALDRILVASVEGSARTWALAVVALLHAKEKTGIERARLGTALIAGDVSEEERLSIAGLVAARASYLHVFSAAAPARVERLLRSALATPPAVMVRHIEDQVVLEGRVPDIDAGSWFEITTRTIDAFAEIAEAMLSLSSGAD